MQSYSESYKTRQLAAILPNVDSPSIASDMLVANNSEVLHLDRIFGNYILYVIT